MTIQDTLCRQSKLIFYGLTVAVALYIFGDGKLLSLDFINKYYVLGALGVSAYVFYLLQRDISMLAQENASLRRPPERQREQREPQSENPYRAERRSGNPFRE